MTLLPEQVIAAGAQWNVDGGDWQDSGATVEGLDCGTHTVEYKPAQGFVAPATEDVTISGGQALDISRTYTSDYTPPMP